MLDDVERAGLAHHVIACPDCGATLTVPADWSVWGALGLPLVTMADMATAARTHAAAAATRGCTTILERSVDNGGLCDGA